MEDIKKPSGSGVNGVGETIRNTSESHGEPHETVAEGGKPREIILTPEELKPEMRNKVITGKLYNYILRTPRGVKLVEIYCEECGALRLVKPQDRFQVKLCIKCTRRKRTKKRSQRRRERRQQGQGQ